MVDEKPFNTHYLMQYIKKNNNLIILKPEKKNCLIVSISKITL